MSLSALDRHRWSLKEAIAYVREAIDGDEAERSREQAARRSRSPFVKYEEAERMRYAQSELMTALITGTLHAEGRCSTIRGEGRFGVRGWVFHSSDFTWINPAEWLEGRSGGDTLELPDKEFIDIRVPRFMILAIWSKQLVRPRRESAGTYSTPYMDLMQEAIEHFDLAEDRQDKKDNIYDWLLKKGIEGEELSRNLADAMATMVRMPSSQRGGAKRTMG